VGRVSDLIPPAAAPDPPGLRLPSPLTELHDDRLARAGVRLHLKRDDLIGSEITGNKWRKLKYNLQAARAQEYGTLLTFGGAYSGHIRAVAAAGRRYGFATVGVIRGEEHLPLNESLAVAAGHGMRLTYLDRASYRRKHTREVVAPLIAEFGPCYVLPEGGSNALAVRGCAEIPAEITAGFDVICCPCGTGGTLAGLAAGLRPGQRALGFSVLKGSGFLDREVTRLQQVALGAPTRNWSVSHDFHFGGYARAQGGLTGFVADFERRHELALDWVYVAKMMCGMVTLAEQGAFKAGTGLVALITGPPGRPGPGR
jgi:1-aminocyclopropane-1-carboxylate deaminase/D-cysteine desulfhydrase-like pyridoxal-dependent ACC family enzyme